MDFFNRRKKNATDEMSFIDHLEELRWHLIRSVIAILVCAIVVFIYVGILLIDTILFAPTQGDFITYRWLCNLSHASDIGDTTLFAAGKS